MKNVRIIPALPKENKKHRVAAYCRVSTFGPAQLRSLEIQIETYTKMIQINRDWLFAVVFYDIESGLRRRGRTELDKMLRKAAKGKIDYIITKSISRVSRDTLEVQTKESTDLVEKADVSIKEQTKSVKESADCFSEINYATSILFENISKITDAVYNVDSNKEQVMKGIEIMSNITEETAASSEEVSASMEEQLASLEELNIMAKDLNSLSGSLSTTLKCFNV